MATLAAFPALAGAAPEVDARIVTDTFTLVGNMDGDGQAFCPAGSRVVGGGVTSTGVTSQFVRVSGPLDETGSTALTGDGDIGRSWYASVENNSGTNTFKVTALCSRASDATLETDEFTLGGFDVGDGQPFCPVGTRVIGGGVTSTVSTEERVRASGPLDETGQTALTANGDVARSFYATVQVFDSAQTTFKVMAICSRLSDATLRVDNFTLMGGADVNGDGQAFCRPGSLAVGGGVTSTGSTLQYVRASGPLDETGLTAMTANGDVARSYYGRVANPDTPNTFQVSAVCAPARCAGVLATRVGTARSDTLRGTPRRDVIVGLAGNDVIRGLAGNDLLCGGAGADRVIGGKGRDILLGESGKDRLEGGDGKDVCKGGAGKDSATGCEKRKSA